MTTLKRYLRNWLLTAAALLASSNAFAAVLFTTLPGPQNGGPCFGLSGANFSSVGIQVPGTPYNLGSVTVRLHHNSGANNAPFSLDLYSDNAGFPGTLISNIGSGTGHGIGTQDLYTVEPPSLIPLAANTTYWIVASSSDADSCAFAWSVGGSSPSGVFSYVGEEQYYNSGWNNNDGNYEQLEISDTLATPAAAASPIPTLSEWNMLLLSLSLAAGAILMLHRRQH